MKLTILKTAFIASTMVMAGSVFAADALFDPEQDNARIILAAQTLANPNGPQGKKICDSEKVGNKICVTCEYTAINETTFNCYKIPKKKSSTVSTSIKAAG